MNNKTPFLRSPECLALFWVFYVIEYLNFPTIQLARYYYYCYHFKNKETKAQRGKAT